MSRQYYLLDSTQLKCCFTTKNELIVLISCQLEIVSHSLMDNIYVCLENLLKMTGRILVLFINKPCHSFFWKMLKNASILTFPWTWQWNFECILGNLEGSIFKVFCLHGPSHDGAFLGSNYSAPPLLKLLRRSCL